MLSVALAFVFAACGGSRPEQKPDYDAVRQRAKEASKDVQREEDKRSDDEDDDEE
jgi:hypothetical protein